MRRRRFVTLLGGGLVSSSFLPPLAAGTQQPGKLPTIGFLGGNTPSVQSQWTAAFTLPGAPSRGRAAPPHSEQQDLPETAP